MKLSHFRLASILIVLAMLSNCKKHHDDPIPNPIISSFTPESGGIDATVTIEGLNFSTTLSHNVIKFNGTAAIVTSATLNQLVTTVPIGATSGKITVIVEGRTTTSESDFTVLDAPTITSFTPEFYQTDTNLPEITITGTNFSPVASENEVKFNGTLATVGTATATQLSLTLPSGVTTGKITVKVNGQTATSENNFIVGCPDVIITDIAVSNIVGNGFTVTYHLKNIGAIPLDINFMYLQAYVATAISTSSPGVQYQGAGGFSRYGCCGNTEPLLQPNEVREMSNNSVNGSGSSITQYPFVILQVLPDVDGPTECNAANNELGHSIQ